MTLKDKFLAKAEFKDYPPEGKGPEYVIYNDGRYMENSRLRPLLLAAADVVSACEGYAQLVEYQPQDSVVFALGRLTALLEGEE